MVCGLESSSCHRLRVFRLLQYFSQRIQVREVLQVLQAFCASNCGSCFPLSVLCCLLSAVCCLTRFNAAVPGLAQGILPKADSGGLLVIHTPFVLTVTALTSVSLQPTHSARYFPSPSEPLSATLPTTRMPAPLTRSPTYPCAVCLLLLLLLLLSLSLPTPSLPSNPHLFNPRRLPISIVRPRPRRVRSIAVRSLTFLCFHSRPLHLKSGRLFSRVPVTPFRARSTFL
jgi:hypothetical protein